MTIERMIAESTIMKKILNNLDKIAQSNASVFIHGESGTGKEVVAQIIHAASMRASQPFIKVNCAAIPETLLESEFFGHEKGAFTGAHSRRLGRFELADKGTLLLDEITEIPLNIQAKLLRAVQEQEFERVGGQDSVIVDVRLIATSNRDMLAAIGQKIFREDLFYRLNVIPIFLPPLRERTDDIIPLAEYFIARLCIENRKEPKKLAPDAEKILREHPWPGNIRELANVIERAIVLDVAEIIAAEHLSLGPAACRIIPSYDQTSLSLATLAEVEKQHILKMLDHHQGNRVKTAQALDISIRTLRNKLKEYACIHPQLAGKKLEAEDAIIPNVEDRSNQIEQLSLF